MQTGHIKYTAISRRLSEKMCMEQFPKGNIGYDRYTVPDTVVVEPTFAAFL